MGQTPNQPRPGVRCGRLRSKQSWSRFLGGGLLSRNGSHIRLPRSSRLRPCNQAGGVRENQTPADFTLSLRESSRDRRGAMGTGANGGEDGGRLWLRPEAVARIDFFEWTNANHLRHTKVVALRNDKKPT